jgi:hypothetical protein
MIETTDLTEWYELLEEKPHDESECTKRLGDEKSPTLEREADIRNETLYVSLWVRLLHEVKQAN